MSERIISVSVYLIESDWIKLKEKTKEDTKVGAANKAIRAYLDVHN